MEYYSSLGLERGASASEIKKAFRKKAMKFHPDKNPGNKQAEAKFKEINEAYEVLSDPNKKAKYDMHGHAGLNSGNQRSNYQSRNQNDIFEEMFGNFGNFDSFFNKNRGRGQRQDISRGTDIHIQVSISLSECVNGSEKAIDYSISNTCEPCHGTGSEEPLHTCQQCGGSGQISFARGFMNLTSTCPGCNGKGRIIKVPCRFCRGRGVSYKKTNSILNIPKGIRPGQRLKVDAAGNRDNGLEPGDLYVDIVFENSNLEISGNDLISSVQINCIDAMLGCEILTETVDGKKIVKVPAGIQNGNKIRIPNQGLPVKLNSSSRGHFMVEVNIVIPRKISPEVQSLLSSIRGNL
ncbi:MAG: molecular chaperone DnaJ [Woeseia sp.]|nr:molecular chaperone DnaJ [Woeseia sp.]|tara:strand:+ start:3909 stop:4958 length:1050 start_codon:yes stop_codon:yes gene_type:complete